MHHAHNNAKNSYHNNNSNSSNNGSGNIINRHAFHMEASARDRHNMNDYEHRGNNNITEKDSNVAVSDVTCAEGNTKAKNKAQSFHHISSGKVVQLLK